MDAPVNTSNTDTDSADDPDEPVIHSSKHGGLRNSVLGTRNLMTVAALGVVGSIVIVPLTYLSLLVAVNPRGILIMCAAMGTWFIPYMLPGVIVNKPGVFIINGLIMGIITAFFTPQGPGSILGNVIGSLFVGAPVALFLYRKWTWWVYALSGVVFGGINASAYGRGFGVALTSSQVALGVALAIISCWAAVAVCLALKRALARTGVGVVR
jgi:ABC transporter, permease protein